MIADLKRVLIHGMGMMGASLARALLDHPDFRGEIVAGVRSEASARIIREKGLATAVCVGPSPADLHALNPDFVILAMPVLAIEKLLPELSFACPVTDMGSTRKSIEAVARGTGLSWVGSHPMCGSEKTGPESAVTGLYRGRLCLVIDGLDEGRSDRDAALLERVSSFWAELGMHTLILDASTHDRLLAGLSHTPHFISSALARTFLGDEDLLIRNERSPVSIMGSGLRDMLRIAGSNPEMWRDIMATNRASILAFLESFRDEIDDLLHRVRGADASWVIPYQQEAKGVRDRIYGHGENGATSNHHT